MLPQKVNYCGVERLGSLDVDRMPGVGPDYPKSWMCVTQQEAMDHQHVGTRTVVDVRVELHRCVLTSLPFPLTFRLFLSGF